MTDYIAIALECGAMGSHSTIFDNTRYASSKPRKQYTFTEDMLAAFAERCIEDANPWIEDYARKDARKTAEYNLLVQENRALAAALTGAEPPGCPTPGACSCPMAAAAQAAEPVAHAWFHRGMANFDPEDSLRALDDRKGTPIPLYLAPHAPAAQPLQAFAQAIMGNWPDVGGLDGFDLQLLGVKHGLLREEIRHEPCGEACRCVEDATSDEWQAGVTCYRKTELLTGIAPSAQTGEQAP